VQTTWAAVTGMGAGWWGVSGPVPTQDGRDWTTFCRKDAR
jgi:hypothetical protein